MTGPALAKADAFGRRFYTFGDPVEAYWSVTTIISGGIPKHLQAHYAKMAAELAYEAILERGPYSRASAIVRRLAARGRTFVVAQQAVGALKTIKLAKLTEQDLALRWIKGAADRHRDAAGERGTAVHAAAEELVLTHAREASRLILDHAQVAPWPPELVDYQRSFVRWLDDFQPEFLAAEATVLNHTQAYGGTLDAIVRVTLPDGTPLIVLTDYKSGRDVYDEVALQLAAYARAEFIAHPDGVTKLPMPEVEAGALLHLTPTGYRFQLIRIDEPIFDAFKHAREVFRYREQTGRTVWLQDLTIIRVTEEVAS